MSGVSLVITRAGLEECVSASSQGVVLNVKWVSAGDESYTPNAEQTALVNELQRVEFSEYKDLSGGQVQAVGKFSGPDEYAIREIGFWLESGTLLGVFSTPGVTLNYKVKDGHCIQPLTLDLSALPSNSVQVVVGTENLNILMDDEFMMDAAVFIKSQVVQVKQTHRQMQLSERLRVLEMVNV